MQMGEKGEKLKDNRSLKIAQVRSDQGPDQVAALGNLPGNVPAPPQLLPPEPVP